MSDHQKRLSVPKSWPVERKEETFTVTAGAGPHGEDGVPLLIVLRDVLGYADSRKEARYALNQDNVVINGTPVNDEERPVGMFDIVAFDEREEYYRVFPDEGGRLTLTPIDADAAGSKLGRIDEKRHVPGGDVQLTLHDGQTLLIEDEDAYTELESFAHLERVLDEQCYRIPELEEDEKEVVDDDQDDDDDDDSPGWEPVRTFTNGTDEAGKDGLRPAIPDDEADGESQDRVELRDGEDIDSDSLQHPHDDEATFRRKHDEQHVGYVANVAETCDSDDPFRLITAVRVDTNNTADSDLLDRDVDDLVAMGLTDLLNDGGYTHQATEAHCREQGITKHFTGITGTPPPEGTLSLATFDWDGYTLLACAAGHEPLEQSHSSKGRISFRMAKQHCQGCEYRDSCRVEEKQNWYSYGFWERKLDIAKRRARLADPASQEFLNLRAGAESMINEVHHQTGKRTKYTGRIKVKNASVANAIGTNLKRVSRHLNEEAEPSKPAG